ncbi:MAG: NAD(P)H-dependent oxidoreductase subunit E [Deltaproteobacteria bacterium]|jgi:NADH-quinone oxidoreductase subunit E|nr:NAD(P)H-dependent oxidoreductase subunit E [Deltaproteobacteria bacterium]
MVSGARSSEPSVAFSDETRAAIEAEMAKFPEPRGAMLAALRLVQEELGYIGPDAARRLAAMFGLRPVQVLEIVSFYNMFYDQPQGRHHVCLCTNLSCSLRGARTLLEGVEEHLGIRAGETTPDGRITLGREECLGACAYAPMLRVDETYHEDLDLPRVRQILDELE